MHKLHARPTQGQRGFTLIEVMIAVTIVAILAAVALPQYSAYVVRSRVPDATAGLSSRQVRMEQYFQDTRTYVGAPDCTLNTSASQYFNFSCSASSATGFTLQAVGKGQMTGFTYTVNQSNQKNSTFTAATGWTNSTSCWVTKKDGAC